MTESIIGKWFAQGGERRERVVLATKVYGNMSDWPNDSKLSARHIKQACDNSLRRLQTDYIDLYQMHHIDRATPWEEIWQAMEQLYQQGKILYVGSSNFAGWHIAQANEQAAKRNFFGLVSEHSLYNLTMRMIELEVIPACERYGMGIMPWSPLGSGVLAGLNGEKGKRRASENIQQRIAKRRTELEAFETLSQQLGEHPSNVALAWLLHQRAVVAPIIGPRTMEQFTDALRAVEIAFSDDVLTQLDTLFPGPGGTAPEAYAW